MPKLPKRARHDPSICGAPGLFRSLARGTRGQELRVDYTFGSETVRFSSPVLLGCDDLRVLQGIMTLATLSQVAIDADTKNDSARGLRSALRLSADAKEASVLLVETSLAKLAVVAGYGAERGGAMGSHLRASLERLAGCSIAIASETSSCEWRLLAWDTLETGRHRLRIALNPRSSRCALGLSRYTLIDMDEARSLNEDVARLCHQRLSTWIDAAPKPRPDGHAAQKRVRLATLADYAWTAESQQATAAAMRQRRATLRSALGQLRAAGWCVNEVDVGADVFAIERPALVAA